MKRNDKIEKLIIERLINLYVKASPNQKTDMERFAFSELEINIVKEFEIQKTSFLSAKGKQMEENNGQ